METNLAYHTHLDSRFPSLFNFSVGFSIVLSNTKKSMRRTKRCSWKGSWGMPASRGHRAEVPWGTWSSILVHGGCCAVRRNAGLGVKSPVRCFSPGSRGSSYLSSHQGTAGYEHTPLFFAVCWKQESSTVLESVLRAWVHGRAFLLGRKTRALLSHADRKRLFSSKI